MVGYPKGIEILEPVRRGIPVKMTIGVGTRHVQEYISGQSVVFVAIAFITMMIISLAWLIFYYVQRFLYTGSQFGRQVIADKTKKVISQLQLHTVKHGDKGLDVDAENCAVCIENYKLKDIKYLMRTCIDPWLLDHRTCPMCKLDVIKALGYWDANVGKVVMPFPLLIRLSPTAWDNSFGVTYSLMDISKHLKKNSYFFNCILRCVAFVHYMTYYCLPQYIGVCHQLPL
uniref:RING-type domain-containing protein n=1 Tax=Chelonoidis abingdonii TaxID=106734 RepID=A0A8C0IMW6_CHEAB